MKRFFRQGREFPDYIVKDAKMATAEAGKQDRELRVAFLSDYKEYKPGSPMKINLVVVRDKKLVSGNYDSLKVLFPRETYVGCYSIEGFLPEEFGDSNTLDPARKAVLTKVREEGRLVYRRRRTFWELINKILYQAGV